jgi:predicted lipid-binding transport protein (Tim44 family)
VQPGCRQEARAGHAGFARKDGCAPAPPPRKLTARSGAVIGALHSVAARLFGRRRPVVAPVAQPVAVIVPRVDSSLDRGLADIRRTDPRFDPSRFAGYAGMVFRDTYAGWMTGDVESLRDRVTPELFAELQARCDRMRNAGHVYRADDVDVVAAITGAWQDGGRDYVTASVAGSILEYTVDASDHVVDGARATARAVDESWTFTRPSGLNFWTLSLIAPSARGPHNESP